MIHQEAEVPCENVTLYIGLQQSWATLRFKESLEEVKVLSEAKVPHPLSVDE